MKYSLTSLFVCAFFLTGFSVTLAAPIVPGSFSTTWKTDNPGTTAANQIRIPTTGSGYNYNIYWEDVASSTINGTLTGRTGATTITFPTPGTYRVDITGTFPRIFMNCSGSTGGDRTKLLTIEQWGSIAWSSMTRAFCGATNLTLVASDAPNLAGASSTDSMFADAVLLNQDISSWDVSTITNMAYMFGTLFASAMSFNQPLNNWNVSNVQNFTGMFARATAFNQDISSWDVSAGTIFDYMFSGATNANPDLSSWPVSPTARINAMFTDSAFNQDFTTWTWLYNPARTSWESLLNGANAFNQDISGLNIPAHITDLNSFFRNNETFNQDISSWDVSHVTNFHSMFSGAVSFDQSLNSWDVSSAVYMGNMFDSLTVYNQPLDAWDVSSVTDMNCMFCYSVYNQPLNSWDVSSVTDFNTMFYENPAFNQPLNDWNTSGAVEMSYMFENATAFDQDLSNWDVSQATDMYNIFRNSALSVGNYSNILTGWSQQALQSGLDLTFIGPNGDLTPYCDTVQAARNTLTTTFNWDITDGGSVPCLLLSYIVDANATLVGNGTQRVVSGEDGTSVEVVPNAGYRFVAWSDARTDNPRIDTSVATSVAVTAILEPDTSNTGGGSSGSQSTKVGQRLEKIQNAVASSTGSIVVTMTTFVHSVKEFIDYLITHEDEIDALNQEERKTLIIFMRDLLVKLLTFIPGV